jgi:GH15 family glucan-1,4-alpha-glucosidase
MLIEDYALVGELQFAALIGKDGAVDWLCCPRFDSPACIAALLGETDRSRSDAPLEDATPAAGR